MIAAPRAGSSSRRRSLGRRSSTHLASQIVVQDEIYVGRRLGASGGAAHPPARRHRAGRDAAARSRSGGGGPCLRARDSSARDSRPFPGATRSSGCVSAWRSCTASTVRRGPMYPTLRCSLGSRSGWRRMRRGCAALADLGRRSTSPRCCWPASPGGSGRRWTRRHRRTSRCRAGRGCRSTTPIPSHRSLAVRLQEMFGLAETPRIARGRVPLTLHLLSPAHRPVQVTRDLGGFWRSSYHDVRKDLRGRYPKHVWPENPLQRIHRRGGPSRGSASVPCIVPAGAHVRQLRTSPQDPDSTSQIPPTTSSCALGRPSVVYGKLPAIAALEPSKTGARGARVPRNTKA